MSAEVLCCVVAGELYNFFCVRDAKISYDIR